MSAFAAGLVVAAAVLAGVPSAAGYTASSAEPASAPAMAAVGSLAAPPVVVALDTSGSMGDPADSGGEPKIVAARKAVISLAGILGADQLFGLVSYPASGKEVTEDGCSRGDLNIALGAPDPTATDAVVRGLRPDGDTPTADALRHARDIILDRAPNGIIVLVSDGLSNCGDPVCDVAKEIRDSGVELTVNTVGFDIATNADAEADLQCVAAATGGTYAYAGDEEKLREALQKAASSYLALSVEVPGTARVATGASAGLATTIPVSVTNEGRMSAPDVRVAMNFVDSAKRGGALLVPRPVQFLGNLEPGQTRDLSFQARPSPAQAGQEFTWVVTAAAGNGGGDARTGTMGVSDKATELAGVLLTDGPVAVLGDSYSSGEGGGDYDPGTYGTTVPPQCTLPALDILSIPKECLGPQKKVEGNLCHRTGNAYGGVLFGDRVRNLACSGATTAAVSREKQKSGGNEVELQLKQLEELTASKEPPGLVLMTFGGNNIGFGPIVQSCIFSAKCSFKTFPKWVVGCAVEVASIPLIGPPIPTCNPTSPEAEVNEDLETLATDLFDIYTAVDRKVNAASVVARRGGQVAPIVVLPYVRIVPREPTTGCFVGFSEAETEFFNRLYSGLNATIRDVVAKKRASNRPFYYAADVESAFLPGNTICAGQKADRYANAVSVGNSAGLIPSGILGLSWVQELAHPNKAGYLAEAQALAGWAAANDDDIVRTGPAPYEWVDRPQGPAATFARYAHGVQVGPVTTSGGPVHATGEGFAPYSEVTVRVASQPRVLTSVVADADGVADLAATLPFLARGTHEVSFQGVDAAGEQRVVTQPLFVTGPWSWVALLGGVGGLLLVAAFALTRRGASEA